MPEDPTPDRVSIGEPAASSRRDRRPWLVPTVVAIVLVAAFAVIEAIDWNYHPTINYRSVILSAPQAPPAVGWWANFPVDASPRPLVLTGSDILDPAGGFPDGDSKLAYGSGNYQLKTALPAAPATVHGLRIVSAERALAELREAGSARPQASTPPLAITAVRLGTATFATDRGPRSLPTWSFRFAGVAEPAQVLAVSPTERWPHLSMPTARSGPETSATLSADGTEATLSFVGMAAGTGPCEAEYTADVSQSRTAVSVSVRELANPNNRNVNCADVGFRRTLTVTLKPPIGNRVLIDANGVPLAATQAMPR